MFSSVDEVRFVAVEAMSGVADRISIHRVVAWDPDDLGRDPARAQPTDRSFRYFGWPSRCDARRSSTSGRCFPRLRGFQSTPFTTVKIAVVAPISGASLPGPPKSSPRSPQGAGAMREQIGHLCPRSNAARRDAPPGKCFVNYRDRTLAAVTGVVAGDVAIGFRPRINFFQNLVLFNRVAFGVASPLDHGRGAWIVRIPPLALLPLAHVEGTFAKETKGHGVPEVMEAVLTRGGRIRGRGVAAEGSHLGVDYRRRRLCRTRRADQRGSAPPPAPAPARQRTARAAPTCPRATPTVNGKRNQSDDLGLQHSGYS